MKIYIFLTIVLCLVLVFISIFGSTVLLRIALGATALLLLINAFFRLRGK